MIRSLETWSVEVCSLAVIAALWRILFPDLKKYGLFSLTRIVLLLCVVRVLIPAASETMETLGSVAVVSPAADETASDFYAEAVKQELCEQLLEKLHSRDINAQDVRIDCIVTKDEVTIREIALVFSEETAEEPLCSSLTEEWGIPVRIARKEEESG